MSHTSLPTLQATNVMIKKSVGYLIPHFFLNRFYTEKDLHSKAGI
jgi:hypothetical protein